MLSDNPITKKFKPRVRSVEAKTNKPWSDKQKIEAVQTYLLLGNLALTSRMLKIPEITLRVWKTTEWWKNSVEDIKQAEKVQLTSRLQKLVGASLAAVEDRLEHGDMMYDPKSAQLIRKPVTMRDAHKVAVDLMAKKDLLEKTTPDETPEKMGEVAIQRLAEQFIKLTTQKPKLPEVEVVDVQTKEI